MINPEMPTGGRQPDDVLVHGVIEALIRQERQDRRVAFDELYDVIDATAQLGTTDPSHQSLHAHPIDGGQRLVSFEAAIREDLGCFYHIIMNDETIDRSDGQTLDIREFVVPRFPRYIARAARTMTRAHFDTQWALTPDAGPILQKRDDRLEVCRGNRSRMPLPDRSKRPDFKDVIERRAHILELTGILKPLNTVTLEEGILLANPQ